jgi:hypothetical protein
VVVEALQEQVAVDMVAVVVDMAAVVVDMAAVVVVDMAAELTVAPATAAD